MPTRPEATRSGSTVSSVASHRGRNEARPSSAAATPSLSDPDSIPDFIPSSCKGAPAQVKSQIRKRQNLDSANRSREKKRVATAALHSTVEGHGRTITRLEERVDSLLEQIVHVRSVKAQMSREPRSGVADKVYGSPLSAPEEYDNNRQLKRWLE